MNESSVSVTVSEDQFLVFANKESGDFYDIPVREYRERKYEWLGHLRRKNWFTPCVEAACNQLAGG